MNETHHTVVIGGGLMGSAAAWQLANQGESVLLLERQGAEYSSGSSFGEARICRSLGPKHDIYSYLHKTGVEETQQLIDFLNTEQPGVHAMDQVYTDASVTYLLHTEKKAAVSRMLRQQKDPYQCASNPEEALRKFKVTIPESVMIVRESQPYTGTMNPKALIEKLHLGISLKGQSIRYHQQVDQLTRTSEGYQLRTTNTQDGQEVIIDAQKIVVASGPYNGTLLQNLAPYVEQLITPKRVALSFFTIASKRYKEYSEAQKRQFLCSFPVIDLSEDHLFGMVEKMEDGLPLLKVGGHFSRDSIEDLDSVWDKEVSEQEIEWSRQQLAQYFETLNLPLCDDDLVFQRGYSCVYSLTESETPLTALLLDENLQPDPNAVLIGGLSGVGAKGALAYGQLAAHLMLGKTQDDFMYQRTREALGTCRLQKEVSELTKV